MQDDNKTTNTDAGGSPQPDMTTPFGVSSPLVTPDPSTPTGPVATAPTTDASQVIAPTKPTQEISTHTEPISDMGNPDAPKKPEEPKPLETNKDLEDIKQKALSDLTPLLSNLDQSPEEKYKTLMMVIQASDNQDLVAEAYETAQKITDDKARADALVGIINEINYFSQQK